MSTESTDTTNAAVAADATPSEVVRPKISDYRRHLLIQATLTRPELATVRALCFAYPSNRRRILCICTGYPSSSTSGKIAKWTRQQQPR